MLIKTPVDSGVIIPRATIIQMLEDRNVPHKSWGTGTSRTLNDLFTYHERDRVYFRTEASPELIIDVHVAVVVVTHRVRSAWLELYEERQVFTSGKVLKRRNFNGIAETMQRSEDMQTSARRCLAEELQFRDPSKYKLSECLEIRHHPPIPSEKWPGLTAVYHRHMHECTISRSLYQQNGYVEEESDGRKIYFAWRPLNQHQFAM